MEITTAQRIRKGTKTVILVTHPDGSSRQLGGKRAANSNFVISAFDVARKQWIIAGTRSAYESAVSLHNQGVSCGPERYSAVEISAVE